MRWLALALLLALPAAGLTACGGGGDDDGGGEIPCSPPGALTTLARQGESAPDTSGGLFATLLPSIPIAAGDGGWAAFAAPVTGGDTTEALYAVQPDGARVRVLAQGDDAPGATSGTIDSIEAIRVSSEGWVLVLVTVTGGGPTSGLVTAHVAGGAVAEIHGVIWDDQDLTATGLTGTLADLPDSGLHLAPSGISFFQGTTTDGDDGFWKVEGDGSDLELLIGTGSSLGGLSNARHLYATAISAGSARYAVVAEEEDGMPGSKGVYVGSTDGSGVATAAAAEGDDLSGGDEILEIPENQALVVYEAGASTGVLFEAATDQADTSVLLGSTAAGAPTIVIAREGDDAPVVQGSSVDLGTYSEMSLLNNGPSCGAPVFGAELRGATSPITIGLFALQAGSAVPVPAFVDGVPAPPDQVGDFTPGFLGIGVTGRTDVSQDGAITYSNVLTSGHMGVYWSIPDCGLFSIARSDGGAPDGGTFDDRTTWRQTAADGVLVFLAPLTGGGAGIYRRGP